MDLGLAEVDWDVEFSSEFVLAIEYKLKAVRRYPIVAAIT
jgi:hypothetical protein